MWDELINLREGKGLSQTALHQQTGIAPATIAAWENEMPNQFKKLLKLCEELGTTPNALLGVEVHQADSQPGEIFGGSIIVKPELGLTREELQVLCNMAHSKGRDMRESFLSGAIDPGDVDAVNRLFEIEGKIAEYLGED